MEGRPNIQARRILRSPSLKRKSRIVPVSEKVLLERVLGLTVTNGAALDTDPTTGTIAYPAGCVIVMYNSRKNKQSHICNQCKKTITCLAFSMDGKFLVTGESGHMPAVRVWDLEDNNPIAQFSGHQFGINCVAFSPNLKYIVSVGTQHDMMVNVWNWKTNAKVASNKIASNVVSIAFTEDSSSFVTVGNRHVKFWYLDASKSRVKETVPLLGRSGILGERKNNFFNGVCCGRGAMVGNTYCITHSGLLCEFNEKRLLSKWVELRTPCAYCLTVGEEYLYVGCADGIVRIFNSRTLNYLSTLPRPHQLGVDIATAVDSSQLLATQDSTASFPDTIAVSLDEDSNKLTCVYNDHSLYIWDVHDIHKIGKTHSFLYHSACIWSAEMYPDVDENPALPPGSFITCSSDDTMRIWNMDAHATTSNTAFRRNIYSNELLKVIYTDPELNNIKDVKFNPAGKTDRTDTGFLEKNGVRAVRVCPRGQHMASGDRVGNIRIHDLHTMEQCHILEAHDSEVLCLEFTNPSTTGVHFLSSASRDRLIHVFDVGQQYGLVQTLDDHSSAITSVKFAEDGDTLHMITCGADKSLLFRTAQMTPHFQFVLNRHLVGKTTLYDMDVDATKKFVVTACQDRNVRIYNIKNGKKKKCYSGSVGSEGTLIRVELDQSGAYLATTCSNKNICLYDFFSGELIASMYGHSEVVTGVKFMNDLKHLISVSGDGCIFVWRLPPEVTEHMHSRLVELGKKVTLDTPRQEDFDRSVLASDKVTDQKDGFSDVIGLLENNFPGDQTDNFPDDRTHTVPEHDSKTNYRFSVGQLPSWAKKQVLQGSGGRQQMEEVDVKSAAPRGRWAENPGIVMKSVLDESSPMKLPLSDIFNCHRFPPGLELASDKLHTVPVVDDDEYNQDDSDDDEFKVLGLGNTDTQSDDRISFLRNCEFGCGDSTEGDDGDETVDREVIYYPANRDDSVSTPSSTFPVFEDRKLKARDDAGLEDMSEDDTDTPQTSSPSTPATEHMKTFPSDDNNMKFIQNNYESLTETEKFDTNLDEVMENCNMTMFPTARLSFSRKFLSNAPSRYPLRNNHAHQSSRHAKTAPPATQPTVSGVGSSDNSSHTEDKMIARSAVRQTDTQQKTAHTQQQTTKWLPPEENKLSTSSRQWKSMLDVAGNGSSKQERAPRSRTPNPLHPVLAARRSFSPSTGLIGGSSELKLPPRRRSMKDDKTLAAPERLSSTRTTGEKATKALGMRLHSYSKATESSNAKKMPRASSNNQMDKLEEAGASRCTGGVISNSKEPRLSQKLRPSRKGNLNAAQKAKFKSTPNLMELNENETDITPMMSASKTMEDLETVDPMRSPPTLPSSRSELRAYKDRSRRSMPVTRDTKGLFTAVESPSGVYSVDLPLNTTFSILSPEHRVLSTESASRTVRQPNNSGPGNEDEDRIAMPPPASHVTIPPPASHVTMPSIAREDKDNSTNKKPEMSLNQAKDILLGRHHAPIAGADKSGSSTIPLQNSKNTKGSTRVMSNTGSVEVERDSRLEPSPLELPVKDSSASEGQQDSMPRVSTEPVLGASRARSMWHSRDQCASPIRTESRPRHRAGAHRRSYSPSPITLARTLSPMTVVNINSEPCARTPMSQPVSTTDIDLSQPAQTDVPVVEGANNGSEPAVNQTEVITSELDTSTMQPADGSNQQQMQLNEFFMSLLSRNSSTASDLEQQMTSSPSDDRPKPGHTAAARSMWENAIQQRDSAQSRRPGVRSKCVRVDSNANCLQGEGDAVSEVTQSEKDRLEHAKTYRSPHSPIVSPVLSSAHEVESAAEPEEILSPTATPGIGGIAISRTEISPVKSNSPPTANLPVPVKSSSPPSVDLPVPVKSSSPPTANLPVHCKSSLPPTTHMPVPAKSSSPPTADLPVPVKSSSPATADLPVPAKSSLPTTADLPVPVKSSSPPTAELPVPAKSSSPPTADLPVAAKSSLPTTADLPVPAKSSLPTTVPVKSCSPPTADLPVPAKSSSPPTADLPVPVNSSSPPTADLPVPAKSSSPPTADLPVPAKSRLPPTVNKGSCTQPSTGPICVSETCKDKQEVSVLTQPAIVNVRANRSRLNLPLEGVTAVVTPKDAEQTCCQLHTTLQETLTMYSQVCSQEDTDEKKELLRRTLVETRQWIDNTLGDRPPPVTAFLDTVSTTGVVDTSVAMLEHYSLQLADRVCALVHDRLLPPGDTTHDTKL